MKGPVDGKESMLKSYYRVRAAFCGRFDYGKEIEAVRDRFPFMLPYVENESNQFSLDLQVF